MARVSMRLQVHVFLMQFMWSRCELAVVKLDGSNSTITEMSMESFIKLFFHHELRDQLRDRIRSRVEVQNVV